MSSRRPLPGRLRRDRMLAVLRERDFVRVTELADRFDISTVTVRADLDVLESRGLARRVRGGAVARTTTAPERPFEEAEVEAAEQKRAIGRVAAALVASGDTIVLDVGSTTTAVAVAIAEREDLNDVTVFTSSLTIALALEAASPRVTVVVTGGTLRPRQHSLVDPLAGLVLGAIHAGTAFVGCNGIDTEAGVTNVNLPETEVKRRMIAASQRRVVCADGSKLGRVALARVCHLDEVDVLVTDATADPALLGPLREAGVDVRLAPVPT